MVSLGWIIGVLAITVGASIWKNKKDARLTTDEVDTQPAGRER